MTILVMWYATTSAIEILGNTAILVILNLFISPFLYLPCWMMNKFFYKTKRKIRLRKIFLIIK